MNHIDNILEVALHINITIKQTIFRYIHIDNLLFSLKVWKQQTKPHNSLTLRVHPFVEQTTESR